MHDVQPRPVKTGSDPRTLADFIALREEMAKLSHPARPDVDWKQAEALSLSLFERNGVELQTGAWYTLARCHLARVSGMNEGLAILNALLNYQWAQLWPQPVHARAEILNGLFQRLQTTFRTFSLSHSDVPSLMQAENLLATLDDVLTRQALKHACQTVPLMQQVHNARVRLENSASPEEATAAIALPPHAWVSPSALDTAPHISRQVYVLRPEPEVKVEVVRETLPSPKRWPVFAAGVVSALVFGALALWGWYTLHPADNTLPVTSNDAALTGLGQQSPVWLQDYGFALAAKAAPEERDRLKAQWQQRIAGNALPPEVLSGWHQGMEGLNEMTRRLNELDERKGKYLTGSELKSMVFAITQNFGRSVPAEEQLYLLSQTPQGTTLPPALVSQTEQHLEQLLNRYTLIKQQVETP
ncbi:hypothetical protein BSPA111_05760 [Buttiauxella sp. A111]|nr:hypothetical protein BSPA111_05760 [Buttiauxella sp. A111]